MSPHSLFNSPSCCKHLDISSQNMQVFAYALFLQMIQNVHSLKYWGPLLGIFWFFIAA